MNSHRQGDLERMLDDIAQRGLSYEERADRLRKILKIKTKVYSLASCAEDNLVNDARYLQEEIIKMLDEIK